MFEDINVDYLYKSQDDWKDLKYWLADSFFKQRYEDCRKAYELLQQTRGERVIDVPHYLDDPQRQPVNPIPNRVIKNIVERCAVLWFIDQRQEDLDYLWEALRYFVEHGVFRCEERMCGGHGLHADLETADASYICGFCLDTYRDLLPDDIRAALIDRLVNNTLPAYMDGVREGDWWRYANFNWGAALHGGSGVGALALWDIDRSLAERVLQHSLDGLKYLWDALPIGGFCTEGQMYQTTTMCHLAEFLMPWHRISGQSLGFLNNHFVEISGDFHMHMQGGDGGALNVSNMFADTTERGGPHFYWWARQYNKPQWAAYEDQILRPWSDTHGVFFDVAAFWYAEPNQERQPVVLQSLFHFPGLDWANFHKGEMWGAVRFGYNANNHNHKSLGSFILGYGRDRFIVMPGYGAGQPDQHNTLTAGPQVEASTAPILRMREWDDGLWLVADLQAAYANRCQTCFRHFLLLENKHFIIIDYVIGKNGKRPGVRWFLQSRHAMQATENGVVIDGSERQLQLQHLTSCSADTIDEWEFKGDAIHRISWTDAVDHVHAVHAQVLSVEPVACDWSLALPEASISMNGRRYTIHLSDLTIRCSTE